MEHRTYLRRRYVLPSPATLLRLPAIHPRPRRLRGGNSAPPRALRTCGGYAAATRRHRRALRTSEPQLNLSLKQMPRDYAKEYRTYHGKPEQIKRRDARNKARAIMVKKGVVRKGDGLHIDHKNNNPLDNRPSNLRAVTQKANLTRKKKK